MAEFDKAINYGTDVIMNYDKNAVDDLDYINLKEKIIKEKIHNTNYDYEEQTRNLNPLFEPNPFISEQIDYGEKNKIKQTEFDPYINFLNQKGLNGKDIKVRYNVEYVNIDSLNRNQLPYNITSNIYKLINNPLSIINNSLQIKINKSIINNFNIGDKFSLTNVSYVSYTYLAFGDLTYNNQVYDKNNNITQQPLLIKFFKGKKYAQISINPNIYFQVSTDLNDAVNFSVIYKYFDTTKATVNIKGVRGVNYDTILLNNYSISLLDTINNTINNNNINFQTVYKNDDKYPYIGNIPISFINQSHQIYITPPDDNSVIPSLNKFYIMLPWASDGTNIYSEGNAENYNITLTFNHYNLIPLNEINADYPINNEHINGYHIIENIDINNNIITTIIYPPIDLIYINKNNYTFPNFGGNNVFFAPIQQVSYGYPSQNNYIINLKKTYNNVVQLKIVDSLFVNPSITFINDGIGKNNRLYFQNIENIEEIQYIELPEGTYNSDSLKNTIEYKFSQLTRNISIINFNYNLNYNVTCNIDNATDIITFKSYKQTKLQSSITNVDPAITQNDITIGTGTYTITILHKNHAISYENPIVVFSGFIDHLGIPASALNGQQSIKVIDENRYSFTINNINLNISKSITNGGNNILVLVPSPMKFYFNYPDTIGNIIGYRNVGYETSITNYNYIQTNTDKYIGEINKDVNGNEIILKNKSINFKKYEYFFMNCNLTNINNLSNAQTKEIFFAKFRITDDIMMDNSYSNTPIYFYDPLVQLNQLGFTFYNPDNTFVDFKNKDHSFVLEITTIDNLPGLSAINPNISVKT
jgi:hypothetical protein